MEKKQFQNLFRRYMKDLDFHSKGNVCYKYISDDYLIVAFLEHCSYRSAYRVVYGVIYEPNSIVSSSLTKTDWRGEFLFTLETSDDLSKYPIDELQSSFYLKLVDWFDYVERSEDEFMREMDVNVQKRLLKLYDKEFVLEQYTKNWIKFRRIPYDTVKKICRIAGLNYDEVVRIRDSRVRKWP